MKQVNIHLVSDSSGQTTRYAANAALTQFPSINAKKYNWPLVRTAQDLEKVKEKISKYPGPVLYTLSCDELSSNLKKFCDKYNIPSIAVVKKIINELSNYWDVEPSMAYSKPELTKRYFNKVDAMEFALKNDDGMMGGQLNKADIVLIGPSRTSKTPTSMYLAYNGFKTANIPYILGMSMNNYLDAIAPHTLVVGFIIRANHLMDIRRTRMIQLKVETQTEYTNLDNIKLECREVKDLCQSQNWPIIDVSYKSIEETAAEITQKYYELQKRLSKNNLD